jgi:hypothetical protein
MSDLVRADPPTFFAIPVCRLFQPAFFKCVVLHGDRDSKKASTTTLVTANKAGCVAYRYTANGMIQLGTVSLRQYYAGFLPQSLKLGMAHPSWH